MTAQWKNILVPVNSTIRDALEVINKESYRMALVVDDDERLVGSVTDGDIRRALLNGLGLESHIRPVMNSQPKTAGLNTAPEKILEMINAAQVIGIPVVSNGQVQGVLTRGDLQVQGGRRDNPVVLMAGGFGKRLRPLTYDCPKPLLKIGDTPILEIILDRFVQAGFHKFFISTHYMSSRFQEYFGDGGKWDIQIEYLVEREPLGTAGALGLLPLEQNGHPVIVMNGDILTGVNFSELLDDHVSSAAMATMCVSEHEYEIPFGVVDCNDGHVVSLQEKPRKKVSINSGIYVLDPLICESVESGKAIDMTDILRKILLKGQAVNSFYVGEYWLDIGRHEDYEYAQKKHHSNIVSVKGHSARS